MTTSPTTTTGVQRTGVNQRAALYACTNQAESFFSRLRRMEIGTHHLIPGLHT